MDRTTRSIPWRSSACSPRARGWTSSVTASDDPAAVFPACAGMDRGQSRSCRNDARVPRVRGDGPMPCSATAAEIAVFPACAGMDRRTSLTTGAPSSCSPRARGWTERPACRGPAQVRVPRVRGDGPVTIEAARVVELVFPACAGMDRTVAAVCSRTAACSPRARGWTVRAQRIAGAHVECSPRARGWTDHLPWAADLAPGVPRVRGDGPIACAV